MRVAKAVTSLTEAFERLPGIGPKTAQRLTYYLLHVPQMELDRFANALKTLKTDTVECEVCHNISESQPCDICGDINRNKSLVCVVEQPLDVFAIESSGRFDGVYHVLHGIIDPLHNIGPDEIRLGQLFARCNTHEVKELLLALNPNMEGEATCLYIKRHLENETNLKITRLASGLATGSEIEYADALTLQRAIEGRREF